MKNNNDVWKLNIRKSAGYLLLTILLVFLLSLSIVSSLPTAPGTPTYVSNTTFVSGLVNRSTDTKGTITTVVLTSTQQDYKWKAYVGNVSGSLSLANAAGTAIYSWSSSTPLGEIFVSRTSAITWANIVCATQTAINNEQTAIGMSPSVADNINATFNTTGSHTAIDVGTVLGISGCRSTAPRINTGAQSMSPAAMFQEILLQDSANNNNLVYTGRINDNTLGYDGNPYDFQILVGENESATTPSTYFFWVELG